MTDRPSLIGLDAPTIDWSRLSGRTGVEKPVATPSFMETARASFNVTQADQVGDDEQAVIDAYGPLVTELNRRGHPVSRYVIAARGNAHPVNEDAVWQDIAAVRQAEKGAFEGIATNRAQFRAQVLEQYRRDIVRDADTVDRGGTIAAFAGGVVASFTDPINVGTMFVGGGGATVARRIASEALANAGVELIQQPLVAEQRKRTGRSLSAGEAAANVGFAGVAGGAFAGAAAGARVVAERARSPAGLLATRMREAIGWGRMTPEEQGAVRVLEREDEIIQSSPFEPGASTERYVTTVEDMVARVKAGEPVSSPRPLSIAEANARLAADPWEQVKSRIRVKESGGDDGARNPRSTATGRYQFIDSTWLHYARRMPGVKGMDDAGLLRMRSHPAWQERIMDMAGADNRAALDRVGAAHTTGNMYLMHFAGESRGRAILTAAADTPIERIVSAKVIEANPFLRGKTAEGVIAWAHRAVGDTPVDVPRLRRDAFVDDDAGDLDWQLAQRELASAELDARLQRASDADPPTERDAFDPRDWAMDGPSDAPAPIARQIEPEEWGGSDRTWSSEIAALREAQAGEVAGMLRHPAIDGPIDVKWGRAGDPDNDYRGGYGLAHILAKHPEMERVLDDLPDIIARMDVRQERPERVVLNDPTREAAIALTWHGKDQRWLVTAFEREAPAGPTSERGPIGDVSGSPRPGGDGNVGAQREAGNPRSPAVREGPDPADADGGAPAPRVIDGFDHPDDVAAARQIDSLEHDLRMFLAEEEAAGMTVRLDEEGDVVSAIDALDDVDADEAAIAAARACMVPGGDDA